MQYALLMGPGPRGMTGFLGDIELAEDAAQEAFVIAAERWPRDGEPPTRPAG